MADSSKVSSSEPENSENTKSRVTLRPSVLRVGKSDSTSVPLEAEPKLEAKVFKFTPLSGAGGLAVSSSTDNSINKSECDAKKPKSAGGAVNGTTADEVSTSNSFKACSLFSTIISHNSASPVSSTTTPLTTIPSSSTSSSSSAVTATATSGPGTTATSGAGPGLGVSEPTFVFGQNLEERVLLPDSSEESNDVERHANLVDNEHVNHEKAANSCCTSGSSSNPNVTNSTNAEKRKFDQTFEAITGEEGESNVMQMYCKLYSWESLSSSWKEKGKGILRLNDKKKEDKLCSRLVMRTSGSLKVILNCVIIAGMKCELANEQCLRFTNVDGIYLIKGKDKDIERINSAIDCRLRELSKKIKTDAPSGDDLSKEKPSPEKTSTTSSSSSTTTTTNTTVNDHTSTTDVSN